MILQDNYICTQKCPSIVNSTSTLILTPYVFEWCACCKGTMCIAVPVEAWRGHQLPWDGRCGCLSAAMEVARMEPRSFARATRALDYVASSPPPICSTLRGDLTHDTSSLVLEMGLTEEAGPPTQPPKWRCPTDTWTSPRPEVILQRSTLVFADTAVCPRFSTNLQ